MAQPALRIGFGVKATFKNQCNQAFHFLFIAWVLSSLKNLKAIDEVRAGLGTGISSGTWTHPGF